MALISSKASSSKALYPAAQYQSELQQQTAANFGMWVFLSTEILFFGGLFMLYAAYRMHEPQAFSEGVRDNTLWFGSFNTGVLLTSSYLVAKGVDGRHARLSARWLLAAAGLGAVFLLIKAAEYYDHFQHSIYPGGTGTWFEGHAGGTAAFWTLYFVMTALHALHVVIGMGLLAVSARALRRVDPSESTNQLRTFVSNVGLYWHFVDIVWLFLWPCFYLMGASS